MVAGALVVCNETSQSIVVTRGRKIDHLLQE
jgi:hypothetical protein